jgi:hypothetical protein
MLPRPTAAVQNRNKGAVSCGRRNCILLHIQPAQSVVREEKDPGQLKRRHHSLKVTPGV